MSWIPPKTNWKETDFFNIEDYNRIVSNMYYLQELSAETIAQFELLGMEKEKQYYSMFYASEMNMIEENLDIINKNTFGFDIGDSTTYAVNGATPLYTEFNRIESACERIFNAIYGQTAIREHLAIRLGQKNFGKRCKYAKDEINDYRLAWKLGNSKGVIRV